MRDAMQHGSPSAGCVAASGVLRAEFERYRRLGDPTVSVVITCHNYGHFLADCIESVLAQTRRAEQVLIVDDGSTDHSPGVAEHYRDSIDYIRTENRGQGAAFNRGFAAATGDLILFLDADDLLKPEALETAIYHWHDDLTVLTFGLEKIDDAGRSLGLHDASLAARAGDNRPDLLATGTFAFPPTSGNLFSRQMLARVMPMPEARWRISADCFLIRAAALLGRAGHVPRVLGEYRVHGSNNYARSAPGIQDHAVERQNAADIADALDALATHEGVSAGTPEEAEDLAAALRWQAASIRTRSRGARVLTGFPTRSSFLEPRWPAHVPFGERIDLLSEVSHRAAIVQQLAPDGLGAACRPRALFFAVDPARETLIVRAELRLLEEIEEPVLVEVWSDGTAIWSGRVSGTGEIAFPLQRDPWAARRRVSLRLNGDNAVVFAALSITPAGELGAAPRLPEGRLARLRFEDWPGLSPLEWAEAEDHVLLAGSEGKLRFSAHLAHGGRLQLSIAAATVPGFLRILHKDRPIFAGDVTGPGVLLIEIPPSEERSAHALKVAFWPEDHSRGGGLALDGIGFASWNGVDGAEDAQPVNPCEIIDFNISPHAVRLLAGGWVKGIASGARNDAAEAMLRLAVAGAREHCRLKLSLSPLLPPVPGRRHVLGISMGGAVLSALVLEGPGEVEFELPALPPDGLVELGFHSVFVREDGAEAVEPETAPFELSTLQVIAKPDIQPGRLRWAPRPKRVVFRQLIDDISAALAEIDAEDDPDVSALCALREKVLEMFSHHDPAALMMIAASRNGIATLDALGAAGSALRPSETERRLEETIGALDAGQPGVSLRQALADLVTRPAYRSAVFRNPAALPAPLYWRPDAVAAYMARAPLLNSEEEQANYADWLREVYDGICVALATEQTTSAIFKLCHGVLCGLRSARVIFGAGNLAPLIRARSRAIERGLIASGADLAYQAPSRQGGPRRLRVGVLVRDIRANPEGWALLGMWAGVDRARIEPLLIAMDQTAQTAYPGDRFETTLVLSGLTVTEAVQRIRDLDLDLLITGCYVFDWEKTALILAHRLARVQVWHGAVCPTTGGFRSFDVALTHRATEPKDAQVQYTETVAWLGGPVQCAYDLPVAPPAADVRRDLGLSGDAVMLVSGALTHKITDTLLSAWAEILARAPKAALVLYPFASNWSMAFDEQAFRDRWIAALDQKGVVGDRTVVLPTQTTERVHQIVGAADVYLDSFPYTGATTVCEALSQGVPVLTCAGGALRQLTGASWVNAYGLKNLVARSPRSYVSKAVRLATDPDASRRERETLRAFLDSGARPHCDPEFGQALSDALCAIAEVWGPATPPSETARQARTVAPNAAARRVTAPMVRFAILAEPRTGSTLLCNLLNLTPGVLCHFELFHEEMIQFRRNTVKEVEALAERNADPVGFLRRVYAKADAAGRAAMGFKHFSHLSCDVTEALIRDPDIRLIRLGRSNLLAQFSSERISKATDKWASLKGEATEHVRTHFDPAEFERWEAYIRRKAREGTEMLAKSGREALFLDYTTILDSETPARLSRLLGIRIAESREFDIQRQNPVSILDRFTNPDEVSRYLADRNLSHWAERG
ncbi:Putative glycosyltransferase EpsH [Defluviimonas aquaemixtae]|uniref:Glycosyltransferase EpsH n=1 Tax=Albidovulum aquaemixtae TaxID=1542388 RepID=A0A2R8B8P7_9RHOB|nr:glycosyltransferase [Defluviimonas aquaemixtae]SPH18823.1 Putative glycosyltransferase EpsH [Defluviimonas aquaemixtae]